MQIQYYIVTYISQPCSRFRFGLTKFSNKKINGRGGTDHVYQGIQTIFLCYIVTPIIPIQLLIRCGCSRGDREIVARGTGRAWARRRTFCTCTSIRLRW